MSRHRDLRRTQNFVRDEALAERLVAASDIGRADLVYDLGAGTGTLTEPLAKRARHVVAIERDPRLAAALRRRFAGLRNVTVREADLFSVALPREDYVVFANPPFDRTAELLRRLTETDPSPRAAYLVLQREAVARFAGRPRHTLRSALLVPWFNVTVLHHLRRSDFVPHPAVDPVFVAVRKRDPPLVPARDTQLYRDLVVACFVAGRSILDPSRRPTDMTTDDWLAVYRRFRSLSRGVWRAVFGAEARLARDQQRQTKIHRTSTPCRVPAPEGSSSASHRSRGSRRRGGGSR